MVEGLESVRIHSPPESHLKTRTYEGLQLLVFQSPRSL